MSAVLAGILGMAWLLAAVTCAWLWQRRTKNAGVIDGVWALGLGGLGLIYSLVGPAPVITRGIVGVFAVIWSLRLGVYLLWRNSGTTEERRYAELRHKWGKEADLNMLILFIFQAAAAWVIGISFMAVCWREGAPHPLPLIVALLLFLAAMTGETIADLQLGLFQRDPTNAGKVCDSGLWSLSRHPNYFFETLVWWVYPLLALGSVMAWPALIGPLVIAGLLLFGSGIPTSESGIDERRPDYARYRERTSAFLPRPPR